MVIPPTKSGPSAGEIGGIVGGVLGALLLIFVAVTFYLLGRKSKSVTQPVIQPTSNDAVEAPVEGYTAKEVVDRESNAPVDIEVGGRLRYPNEQEVEGGRLREST